MSDLTTGRFSDALTDVEQPLPAVETGRPVVDRETPRETSAAELQGRDPGLFFDVAALPPGSVVDAEVTSKWTGKTARRLFFRRVYLDDPAPWIAQQDVGDQAWWHHDDLRDVTVVYEPRA